MSQHRARLTVLLFAAVLVLTLTPAFAQNDDPDNIPLVPFINPDFGIQGVMPAAWVEASSGQYIRNSAPDDMTVLLQQAVSGVAPAQITANVLSNMGIEEFAENGEYATAAFPWETHRVEDKEAKVVISLALAADENRTYVVLLQAAPEEHDALYEKVFLPVIDALEPLVLSWGHDDEAPAGAELTTPAMLDVEVVSEHPHDPAAFTQGLLWLDGLLYESTGRAGQSTLREVDPETGEALRKVSVPEEYFAEGLALVEDRLVQLTWETGEAFVYDLETFEQTGVFTYEGEGWGLCYDGEYLFRSDGSSVISLHDPETFEVLHRGQVTFQGRPIDQLNELECVGDYLYANVWKQDYILQIDKTNGYIVGLIDASGLLGEEERAGLESAAVLNGIAYNPETGNFWITGKLWPKMFEVQFVEAEEQ